jgi:hypothetical protein
MAKKDDDLEVIVVMIAAGILIAICLISSLGAG